MEITQKEVAQLIEIEKPETFATHVFGVFGYRNKVVGDTSRTRQIRLWKHTKDFIILYAVFFFFFDAKQHLIDIKMRMNRLMRVFLFVLFGTIISFFTYQNLQMWDNERLWIYIIIECFFLAFLVAIIAKVYSYERKKQLKTIYERLDMEIEGNPFKDSTLAAVLIRCLAYPIGLITLYAGIFYFLPKGDFIKATFAILVVMVYFVVDIILVFKKEELIL